MTAADRPSVTDEHGMLPGSHERLGGPECRCGAAWDRWNDRCGQPRPSVTEVQAQRAALAARLAAVEALADEWENNEAYACRDASDCTRCVTYQGAVIRLRAVLSAAPTDTTKETDR